MAFKLRPEGHKGASPVTVAGKAFQAESTASTKVATSFKNLRSKKKAGEAGGRGWRQVIRSGSQARDRVCTLFQA